MYEPPGAQVHGFCKCIPRGGIAEAEVLELFSFTRQCQIALQGGCADLNFFSNV